MTLTLTRPSAAETRDRNLGVGSSAPRPDGEAKVDGSFVFSSDEHHEGSLWGATLRSPYPRARICGIDTSVAEGIDGVAAVLTYADVPGSKTFGMKVADQPVLAGKEVRFQCEPVAIVAATHPDIARRGCEAIVVDYTELVPHTDPEVSLRGSVDDLPRGGLTRRVRIRHGDVDAARPASAVVIDRSYEIGTQDPAFLGPESGLAVPVGDGIELYVSCQNLHLDRQQVAACLGLPTDQVRLVLSGVGGAFGGKEDLNIHVHACLLALRTQRPVRMVYSREESFYGHVHRHPATARVELGATAEGRLTFSKVRLVLDGGAYTSTSEVVIANACYFAAGAYRCANVAIDGYATYTNNPPCGAMRGFGAVQSCFFIESAMDELASELGLHPLELRIRNAIGVGDPLPTGQLIDGPAPVLELLDHLRNLPLPDDPNESDYSQFDLRALPGGVGNVTHGEGVRRGVGYALGMKAIGFSGGVDDTATARVTLWVRDGEPVAEVHSAATELGQGIVTLQTQVVRSELAVREVVLRDPDTSIPEAGASSASRQSWMTCGAILGACRELRAELLERAARLVGETPGTLRLSAAGIRRSHPRRVALEHGIKEPGNYQDDRSGYDHYYRYYREDSNHDSDSERVVGRGAEEPGSDRDAFEPVVATVAEILGEEPISTTHTYHHRLTHAIDDERGQGDAHVAYAYAAHRAVIDVDVELGLVRVVEIATAQDVGKAMNPLAVEGQIEGGIVQGLGLAVTEELQIERGCIRNPSFTDYLIPTMLDVPPMKLKVFEFPHPDSPYGLNGVGEPPNLSSTPAILNAIRNASGLALRRAPIRPADFLVTPEQSPAESEDSNE